MLRVYPVVSPTIVMSYCYANSRQTLPKLAILIAIFKFFSYKVSLNFPGDNTLKYLTTKKQKKEQEKQ